MLWADLKTPATRVFLRDLSLEGPALSEVEGT